MRRYRARSIPQASIRCSRSGAPSRRRLSSAASKSCVPATYAFTEAPGRDGEFEGSIDDAASAVRDALEKATALRVLRADVRVGSYLSGGLDSSLIAALAHRASGDSLNTFSLRFEDSEYDETGYQ